MDLGTRIKELLDIKGISAYKLAKETSTAQSTIGRILKNEGPFKRPTIDSLAKYLNVNTEWLLTGEGDKGFYTLNEPTEEYTTVNDDKIADYLIDNWEDMLETNKKFKMWYDLITLRAIKEAQDKVRKE